MSRLEDLSDGRLVELLTRYFMEQDPMPEVARVPVWLLAEVARRLSPQAEQERQRLATELHTQRHPTATSRRREAGQHHPGP